MHRATLLGIALIAGLAIAQGPPARGGGADPNKRDLPNTTKAEMLPDFLKGRTPFLVTEYLPPQSNLRRRVFRFTFKGDFDAYVAKVAAELKAKGWRADPIGKGMPANFESRRASGNVALQSVGIRPEKLSRDAQGRIRGEPNVGWIGVSYNEGYVK